MSEVPPAEHDFLAGAERRLEIFILALVIAGTAGAAVRWGALMAVAFALGGAGAYLNYRWIVAVVNALMQAQRAEVPRRTYFRLFLPLGLLALMLYVIFSHSRLPLAGVFAGLLVLMAAVLVEAFYELFGWGRR